MGSRGKRNVAFIQGDEPKFLQDFKRRAGYLAGPALEEKFLGGKRPKGDDDADDGAEESRSSASSSMSGDEEDGAQKRGRKRGFSPTARFGRDNEAEQEKERKASLKVFPDEEPLVWKTTNSGDEEDKVVVEEDVSGQADLHSGQMRSDGSEMHRSLDVVYGKVKGKPAAKLAAADAIKVPEITDVEKLVATGGKFLFKKPSSGNTNREQDEPDDEAGSSEPSTGKRWRNNGVFAEQDEAKASHAPVKKKSESKAVSNRNLLSFDIVDD